MVPGSGAAGIRPARQLESPAPVCGAFFYTWASGVHYYAVAAFLGVAVYVVWAVLSLGWRKSGSRIAALCAGGCLFGIPYLAFFLIPHAQEIRETVLAFQGSGGMGLPISRHLELYRAWVASPDHPALVRFAMAAGVPLLLFSTAILAAVPSTRGLALAALPLQAFILLFGLHKPPFYLVHECVLFVTALAIGLLAGADRIAPRLRPVAVGLLAVFLLWGSPTLAHASLSIRPKVHEALVARAASREILGPNARVAGREAGWYVSGAGHWYAVQQDLFLNVLVYDTRTYFSNVDAVVDYTNNSEGPLTTWYADGSLQLRGFYFGETSNQFRLVYLSVHRPEQVVGYVLRNGRLSRFQEDGAGDYAVLSTVCAMENTGWLWPYRSTSSSILHFPSDSPEASRLLVTILAPRSAIAPQGEIGRSCHQISKIPGTLRPADKDALLAGLQRNDPPIHFARMLDEMPGYSGVGLSVSAIPPSGAVRLEGILDLKSASAHPNGRVERTPDLRVTTARGIGAFSAFIPVNHAESVHGPCWVALRLRVLSGHIGFAAYDRRKGSIIARTPQIAGSAAPQTVALQVPDLTTATDILIFNESTLLSGGLVDILDAAVLVKKDAARD